MWLIGVMRTREDMPVWRGRRGLAVLDALAWPLLFAYGAHLLVERSGSEAGPLIVVVAAAFGLMRASLAIRHNERYRFTTWRWLKLAAVLLAIGVLVKFMA